MKKVFKLLNGLGWETHLDLVGKSATFTPAFDIMQAVLLAFNIIIAIFYFKGQGKLQREPDRTKSHKK